MKYTLFVDESGDEGIDKNNNLQSKHFFLGAFIIREQYIGEITKRLDACELKIGKEIHFNRLKHEQKVSCMHDLSRLPIRCFGLISDKSGLDRGGYRQQIVGQKGFFYNKNVHYLLEKVGLFCRQQEIELGDVIFDQIRNKNYGQLRRYLSTIKDTPMHKNASFLEAISPAHIVARSTKEQPLLKVADCISNALFRACVPDKYGYTETRYIDLIKHLFFCDEEGVIANTGIQSVPRGFKAQRLPIGTAEFLLNLKGEEGKDDKAIKQK